MLWRKESNEHDAFYVDLLTPDTGHWEPQLNAAFAAINRKPYPTKSDTIALQKRNEGNVKFRAREFVDALELYGESLRFAQPKSEHISLAYANRATCFLRLKMHENCLKDIELAMEAGYPEHLLPKLQERKEICLKQMQDDPQPVRKLNEPNDQFPCAAGVAEVRTSENDGGNSIVAKTDIDVGRIIVIEDSFQKYLNSNFGSTCNICFKEHGNLVPCKNCAHAMFCPECQGDPLHEYECGLNYCGDSDFNSAVMEGVRGILQMLKVFPNVDDLMALVEQCQNNNPTEWPANLLDDRTKYQLFFGNVNYTSMQIHSFIIYPVYKTLMRIPQINAMFQSTKHQRFLLHAIAHKTVWEVYESVSGRIHVVMEKYFKHSCNPNLLRLFCDGKSIYYSVKPIKRGEQLNTSCISLGIVSTQERQQEFLELGFEKCVCPRCSGTVSNRAQRQRMATDPTYKRIVNNVKLMRINVKKINPSMMMDDCATFLRKYGRMNWCTELNNITRLYHRLYDISLTEEFEHPLAHDHLLKSIDKLCHLFNIPC